MFNALIPVLTIFGKEIKLTYLIISLATIPIFLLYDLLMHLVFKNFTIIINRVVKKTTKTTTPDDIMYNSEEEKKDDIFANSDDRNDNNNENNEINKKE